MLLTELPSELVLCILSFLPIPDVLICKRLCRSMYDIASSSVAIQYRIELYCARQRDVSSTHNRPQLPSFPTSESKQDPKSKHLYSKYAKPPMSIRDRLSCLNQVLSGWRNLTFARHSVQKSPFSPSYVYELSGGKLILGSSNTGSILQQPHLNATTGLHIWDLPSRDIEFDGLAQGQDQDQDHRKTGDEDGMEKGLKEQEQDVMQEQEHELPKYENSTDTQANENNGWRNLHLPFAIADFALDVSQNLIVFVERSMQASVNLHLYTFDGVIPHPDASNPILQMPNQGGPNVVRLYWATIHICGPVLACNFISPRDSNAFDFLVVWDWRTGRLIGQVAGTKFLSFVLLSEDVVAIANLDQESIDTYKIDLQGSSLTLIQKFILPRLSSDKDEGPWSYDGALLRAYPNPSPSSRSRSNADARTNLDNSDSSDSNSTSKSGRSSDSYQKGNKPIPTKLPFTTDDDDGIIACTFESHSPHKGFTFVIHRSSLLRVYDEDAPPLATYRNEVRGLEKLVPWSDWGPRYTRWLDVECSLRWICYVHGHRLAVLEKKKKKFEFHSKDLFGKGGDKDKDEIKVDHLENLGVDMDFYFHDGDELETKYNFELFREWMIRAKESDTFPPDAMMSLTQDELLQWFDINPDGSFAYLRVFNFNPLDVKRAIIDESGSESTGSAVEATINGERKAIRGSPGMDPEERCGKGQILVLDESIRQDRIKTSLPYLETTVRLRDIGFAERRQHIEGVMMNAECIIMMMSKEGRHNTESVEVLNV